MSDAYVDMTRDEYIAKYGKDPNDVLAEQAGGGGIKDHLKSLAVGVATTPTDILALPGLAYSGASALYRSYADDTKFMDEFAKNIQVEDAQKNITNHLNEVANSWKASNPQLDDDTINSGLEQYKKSKQFEDFTTEQLSGSAYLATKAKDTVRRLLGDERPSNQRSWTESAAEIAGGALIPGPAGWATKLGTRAAGNAVTNAIVNNPASRVALKGAELLTPLTMPYTGTNVAANAAVGVGIDQAIRYAQDKPTAFTPTPTDSAGVGALAATGAGIAGLAALVGAVKGRSREVLAASEAARTSTARALEEQGSVNIRTAAEPRVGEPTIVAGAEQQLHAEPSQSTMNKPTSLIQRATTQLVDEGYGPLAEIRRTHGGDEANWMEALRSGSGSVLHDTAPAEAEAVTRELFQAIDNLPNADMRAALDGGIMSTLMSRHRVIERELVEKIDNLEKTLKDPASSTELTKAKVDLARLRDDADASARVALPEIPTSQKQAIAHAFENDPSPEMQQVRDAWKKMNDDLIAVRVSSGKESPTAATRMRAQDPYYMPIINDPLKGLTGFNRVWRSAMNSVDNAMTRDAEGATRAMARESPIHEFKREVPPVRGLNEPETRITAVQDPRTSIARYAQDIYREEALTRSRNEGIRLLTTKKDGTPSDLVSNGNIRAMRDPTTNAEWIPNNKLETPYVQKAMSDPHVVPQWENGNVKFWEIGDRDYAAWLRQDPVRFNGMMKTLGVTSRWFKFFTTGRGNPIFTLKGAAYDLLVGILTRMPNRSFGTLSYLGNRFLPESIAKHVIGRIPDPTALVTVPYHAAMAVSEMLAHYATRKIADGLSSLEPFNAFRRAVGERNYHAMVGASLKVASMAENFATVKMQRFGAARGNRDIDNVAQVRGHYEAIKEMVPSPLKGAWRFYTDVLDSVYLAPKRMFYTENYALLHAKYGGNIPEKEMVKLQYETRAIGGDMSKVPASKGMKDLEVAMPYLSQTKLGAWHLMRHMGSPETASYMLPRLALMIYAVGQSYYWRTYWNEESRKDLWERTPEYDRWRSFDVPTPQLLWAWYKGENPNFNRKLFYRITLPPDFTGIIASATAMMQMMGMIPGSATPRPIAHDLPKIWIDSLTPAMPPLLQALLAQSGMKLDPQGADTRGGQWIRNFGSAFRSGPQAESTTNLGQVSNSTALTMNALFGAFGSYLAASTDVALHAAKFHPQAGSALGPITPRQSADFAAGLKAATTEIYNKATINAPDVPLIWQNKERYKVSTPAWQYVKDNQQYIRSISGMRDDVLGKAAQLRRQQAQQAGGIAPQVLSDLTLIKIAQDVKAWQNPTGTLGKLHKEYNVLSNQNRAVAVQYNLPQEERTRRQNIIIGRMQDNMEQQHLATKYFEQTVGDKYGKVLAPRLQGRPITMKAIDEMLRESISNPTASAGASAE